ncbi:hypothetical protein D3C78_1632640 [compost metagenome]
MLPKVSLTVAPKRTDPVNVPELGKLLKGVSKVNFLPLSEVTTRKVPWLSPTALSKRTLPTREARSTFLSNSTSTNLSLIAVTLLITGAATSDTTVTVVLIGLGLATLPA